MRYDNCLFERCSEQQQQMARTRSEPTYALIVTKPCPKQSYNTTSANAPTLMEVDATCRRRPLLEEEKQRCRPNRLWLYCGCPWHISSKLSTYAQMLGQPSCYE